MTAPSSHPIKISKWGKGHLVLQNCSNPGKHKQHKMYSLYIKNERVKSCELFAVFILR